MRKAQKDIYAKYLDNIFSGNFEAIFKAASEELGSEATILNYCYLSGIKKMVKEKKLFDVVLGLETFTEMAITSFIHNELCQEFQNKNGERNGVKNGVETVFLSKGKTE